MSGKSGIEPGSVVGGVLGSIGLLLLALYLLVSGIQGLLRVTGDEKIKVGPFSAGRDGLWSMVIGGIVSAIGGVALIIVTASG